MALYCSVSSSAPADTNILMGFCNEKSYYLDLATAPVEQKDIADSFLAVIGSHVTIEVSNIPGNKTFDTNFVIPGQADLDTVFIDYNNLSPAEKTSVDNFVALVESLVVE